MKAVLTVVLALVAPVGAGAAQPGDAGSPGPASILHHNPFERPKLSAAPLPVARQDPKPPPVAWDPTLRATLVSGSSSQVNLDGAVLRIGEEYEGFRLLEVHERSAVFQRGDDRRVLTMD